jgi:hypothetical protein
VSPYAAEGGGKVTTDDDLFRVVFRAGLKQCECRTEVYSASNGVTEL